LKERSNTAAPARVLPHRNHLLDALPKGDYERLAPHLELIPMDLGAEGPDHDKRFTVEVYLNTNPIARGTGRSKKEAEQQAARAALELMGQ
jgi:hypothetical protein